MGYNLQGMFRRIGIIGDVHAEHHHLELALTFLQRAGVDTVVCTGDRADGRGDLDACVELLDGHQVQTVRGNHDRWVLENKARHVRDAHLLNDLDSAVVAFLSDLPQEIHLPTRLGLLKLCHGVGVNDLQKVWPGTARMPAERSARMDEIIAGGEHQIMVNGHMHYRTLIHFEALTLLNAGTLRGDHRPGFSMLDLDEGVVRGFELIPRVHEVKVLPLTPAPHTRVFTNTQHFDDDWEPVTLYA